MVTVTVVMPTITGREHWLERALRSLDNHTEAEFEVLTYVDRPACGIVWQEGGEAAAGDYIWMGADDVEVLPGWDTAAISRCDEGALPAPCVYHPDGRLQSCGASWELLEPDGEETEFTRGPFMSRAQWDVIQPMLPTHYWTDNWVSWRGWQASPVIPTVVTWGFRFVHHLAGEGRNEGRMAEEGAVFEAATRGEDVWHAS